MAFNPHPSPGLHSRELRTEHVRALLQAAAAALLACVIIAFSYLESIFGHLVPSLIVNGVLVGLLAVIVYRWRINSSRSLRAVARNQERLAAVVEGTGVGIWEADFSAGVVQVSDSWMRLMGRAVSAGQRLTTKEWRDLLHPDDRQRVIDGMSAGLQTDNWVVQLDHRIRCADGRWIWVTSMSRVIERNAAGEPVCMVGTHVDISARKAAEVALTQNEAKFRSLFERSPVGIALSDYHSQCFMQVNDALREPTGYSREEFLQLSYSQLVVRVDGGPLNQPEANREREIRRKDGTTYPVLISGIRMIDARGRDVVWTFVQDISLRKAAERELAEAARRDRLTGLANRTLFMERLQEAVERVRSGKMQLFAVLFLDFDRFKVVNDAMGHQVGDELLVQIAERLRRSLRSAGSAQDGESANLVARFGGDEFLLLVKDIKAAEDAARIAARLQQTLSPPYNIQGREVYSSASIGIVTSDVSIDSAETIIRNADLAMYEAKRAGRACSVMFNESMHARLSRHLLIETNLRRAIGTGELSVVYQPIVELGTGRRTSVEALVRWHHPVLGQISPAEFVPVAEESGLIGRMGEWVLGEACAALSRWRALDPENAPGVVSVNVSRAELAQGERLLGTIREVLLANAMPAECLQLEVTEREVMRDPEASLELMLKLSRMGVRLAMDDFGTGTSSLGCLREYPFDVIKIDRSFINDLDAGPDTLAVIHATITLVENLGKSSVAEGVETAEQLAILQSLGCQYAQGYHLGYPQPEHLIIAGQGPMPALVPEPAALPEQAQSLPA